MAAILEQEKDAFLKKGQIPWSRPMRRRSRIISVSSTSPAPSGKGIRGRNQQGSAGDKTNRPSAQLEAAEDGFLAPHLVATAQFDGAQLRFRSDGIVENSNDQSAHRWWLSPHRHTDLILERTDEQGQEEEFHIADDGKSLTQASEKQVWGFVQD